MNQSGYWKVGRLLDPRPEDAEFADWQRAVDCAVAKSDDCEVLAVWLMPGGELDVLVFDRKVFKE